MKHETPSTEIFNEIKKAAIELWNTYDNTYGYVTEKLDTINQLTNYQDNIMVCYRMFDYINQRKLRQKLSDETIKYINQNQ